MVGSAEVGIREMSVLPRYFNLIQGGTKTVEVRVAYPANASLAPGWHIRFSCDERRCLTRVLRVTRYDSFVALLVSEGVSAVDPTAPRADVLDALRAIYSPDKESLGVLGIEIERVRGVAYLTGSSSPTISGGGSRPQEEDSCTPTGEQVDPSEGSTIVLLDLKVRDVCIQDPRRETAYLIPASALGEFAVSLTDEGREGAVTFTISYGSLFDALPEPTVAAGNAEPSVILRDGDSGESYYLTFAQLQRFQIDRPDVHPEAKVFTLPMPEALVEEMPSAIRALLQTDSPIANTPS